MTYSAVSSTTLHFLQMVSALNPILCSQCLMPRWWPLIRCPIVICCFLDSFDSSLRSSFSPLTPPTMAISFMGDSPFGTIHDGGHRRVVVVLDVFLIGCSFFLGLFVCNFIPHYHAVAWTPGGGYLVSFILEGSKVD